MLPFWPSTSPISRVYTRRMNGMIKIEGTAVGQQQRALLATWHFDSITYSATFSPDGTQIAVGVGFDILLLSASTGQKVLPPFRGHSDPAQSVQFSHDGARIVSGSLDKTIRVWCAKTGEAILGPLEGHTDWIYSVAFSPDDTRIISGSRDETVRIWDTCTGDLLLGPLTGHHGWIRSVKYSLNGQFILSSVSRFTSISFSPDGFWIVSSSQDRSVCMWDPQSGDLVLGPLEGHTGSITSVSTDKTLRLWDTHSIQGAPILLPGSADSVTSVGFSSDGARIVSASKDRNVCVWEVESGLMVFGPFQGFGSETLVTSPPSCTRIISKAEDGLVLTNTQSGSITLGPLQRYNWIRSAGLSSDGAYLALVMPMKNVIQILATDTGQTLMIIHPPLINSKPIFSTATTFSPDGTRIAVVSSNERTLSIYESHGGKLLVGPLAGYHSHNCPVGFSPDGSRIVSCSWLGIIVCDVQTGDVVVGPFEALVDDINSVEFSPDGNYIVSGADDNAVCVWDAQTGQSVFGLSSGTSHPSIPLDFHLMARGLSLARETKQCA
ncbi:WD40-repeat-containing domain protein [Rhizoctonia solani]|nr:WD40-repeat-containing domain protein [Rhizoctonia solani]